MTAPALLARLIPVLTLLAATAARADDGWPRTRAEQSDYRETSSQADVTAFLDALKARGAPVSVQTIGRSAGGRPLVMAVAARPAVADAAAARRGHKLVVYIQANIHGGEVEGKEAAQMLLRDVARDEAGAAALLDRLVLLVVPVYNVDGNETLGDGATTRPSQDGPARVGRRPNGAGLDLNRDAIKAAAPETQAVIGRVLREWDPVLTFDLHTTNGTRHGYHLTYAPPLNPNTDAPLAAFARNELLPSVRARLKRERDWELFDYGNVETVRGTRGWFTFGDEGRYVTNYVGLRNRLAILSEAASFRPFPVRVEATRAFVRAVLDELARQADRVDRLAREADARVVARGTDPFGSQAPAMGVRFEPVSSGIEGVPLEVVAPGTKVDHHKAPDPAALRVTEMPVYDRFRVTRSASFPAAYLVPAGHPEVIALLRRHGVAVGRLTAPWTGRVRRFEITESVTSRQSFQGGALTRLEGRFEDEDFAAPAGTFVVRTAQPLGLLAFHLLEPEGLDGVAAWGFLGDAVSRPGPFPVLKLMDPPHASAEPVP